MKIIRRSDLPLVPASHEDPKSPGVLKQVYLTKQAGLKGELMMVNWAIIESGKSFAAHYHEDMSEVFIITEGDGEIIGDDFNEKVYQGDCIIVYPNEKHVLKNISSQQLHYIVFGLSSGTNGRTVVLDN